MSCRVIQQFDPETCLCICSRLFNGPQKPAQLATRRRGIRSHRQGQQAKSPARARTGQARTRETSWYRQTEDGKLGHFGGHEAHPFSLLVAVRRWSFDAILALAANMVKCQGRRPHGHGTMYCDWSELQQSGQWRPWIFLPQWAGDAACRCRGSCRDRAREGHMLHRGSCQGLLFWFACRRDETEEPAETFIYPRLPIRDELDGKTPPLDSRQSAT